MKRTAPVDPITYALTRSILKLARIQGRDEVEALHHAGLLLSATEDRRIRAEALDFIANQFSDWSAVQFLRRRHRVLEATTQQDLYLCILGWLQDHAKAAKEAK
jgi:hypothetical protein